MEQGAVGGSAPRDVLVGFNGGRIDHDIVFVGSGASSSYTVIHLIEELVERRWACSIAIVEKADDVVAGIAYGERSGNDALILTTLRDFFMAEELERFTDWVIDNRLTDELMPAWYGFQAGRNPEDRAALRVSIASLCVRRQLVGKYLRCRMRDALESAREAGMVSVQVIKGDVESIARQDGSMDRPLALTYQSQGGTHTGQATRVVLCLGSPPKSLTTLGEGLMSDARVAAKPYANGYDESLERLRSKLTPETPSVLTILGSNASAMEVLYSLERWVRDGMSNLAIRVVSTSGQLPILRVEGVVTASERDTISEELKRLDSIDGLSGAEDLYRLGLEVLERLRAAGLSGTAHLRLLDEGIVSALKRLSPRMMNLFIDSYGNRMGRYRRQTERQYFEAASRLKQQGLLTLHAGRLEDARVDEQGITLVVVDDSGEHQTLETDLLVDCGPVEDVSEHSSNPLIANLVKTGIAHPGAGGGGFAVTDSFIASNGVYVMGPLLSGNVVAGEPVWHMEHCGRIYRFSRLLAEKLARDLCGGKVNRGVGSTTANAQLMRNPDSPRDMPASDAAAYTRSRRKVLVFGASGHAKVVIDILQRLGDCSVAGLIDVESRRNATIAGRMVLGTMDDLESLINEHCVSAGIVAIGDNATRAAVVERIRDLIPGFEFISAVHPDACLSSGVVIGGGTVVAGGVTINAGVRIGSHCILNTNASVDHDCSLGDYVSIAPNATLGGSCNVGDVSAISISATLLNGVTVGPATVIGAGALVLDDVQGHVVAYGHPCRVVRTRKAGENYLKRGPDLRD